jgi:4-diphosphocytidyl-2-C-methyl-D-erythritol kinase
VTPSLLRVRSFAKINLALAVLGKRADGYHEIRTVLQSIDLHDELEFRPAPHLELHCHDLPDLSPEDNLVWRAAEALARHAAVSRGVEIRLKKNIPAGSGLGGGSSNAAATLLALRRFWELPCSGKDLLSVGAALGSDVPFFLMGGTALGIGRGEEIQSVAEPPTSSLLVIYPGLSISTSQAYGSLKMVLTYPHPLLKISRLCDQVHNSPYLTEAFNDFEASILPAYQTIREAKESLIELGATAALLSGSGSSVFGFFKDEESALAASRSLDRANWRVFPAKTLSRSEYLQRMFG